MNQAQNVTPEFTHTYILSTRKEVADMLLHVASKHARVVVTFADGTTEIATRLAHINLNFRELIFADRSAPMRVPATLPNLPPDLITILSDNKLEFHAEHLEYVVFEDHPALRVRIPKLVFCSERRESLRVAPPLDQSLRCHVPTPGLKEGPEMALPVIDVSVGGLALMVEPLKLPVHVGQEFRGCKLVLPGFGEITFNLVIRNIAEASQAVDGRRCGGQFQGINREAMVLVERYVNLNREKI